MILWHGPSPFLASDLLRAPSVSAPASSAFEAKKVEEWLSEKLSTGPTPLKQIQEQATLDEIPPILLRRAQISLNVIPTGRNGSTTWRLPNVEPLDPAQPTTHRQPLSEFAPPPAANSNPIPDLGPARLPID